MTGARRGLTLRTVIASSVVALLLGVTFAVLLHAVDDVRSSTDARKYIRSSLVQAGVLEKTVLDIETGQRGFVITRREQFLQPWTAGRAAFPGQALEFVRLSDAPGQRSIALAISRDGQSFINDYSVPLVESVRRGDPAASSTATTQEGRRRVDTLRRLFDRYDQVSQGTLTAREDAAAANVRWATVGAVAGLAGSMLLIGAFAWYQSVAILRPVRRAAAVAGRLADGDLTTRMPEDGVGEIGDLEVAFNTMGSSLERSLERAEMARARLELLYSASVAVGTTLDVERTVQELARVALAGLADYVTVDLAGAVLQGEEPTREDLTELLRVAVSGIREDAPLFPCGEVITPAPETPQARSLASGRAMSEPDLRATTDWRSQDPDRATKLLEFGMHSLMSVPLRARGVLMGVVTFWRSERSEPFEADELSYAEEVVAKGAVAIDNARRYTRERATALTLQRSLLPQRLPGQTALEVASRYLPAGSRAGVGGDWFDVIPLSGTRVALVVGDVVGHGIHAAATMGRLRTAVRTLADVDLPPDELLTHLDDLVIHLTSEEQAGIAEGCQAAAGELGATCLYAIYDPISRRCVLASAGHPMPFVVAPDGSVELVTGSTGPPLGVGSLPFESVELELAPGSVLALYTDGLIESRDHDIDQGMEQLRQALSLPAQSLQIACDTVINTLLPDPERPADDVALLLAGVRAMSPEQVATWDIPADAARVVDARELAVAQLEAWGLQEAQFITELVVSELVTNAIRYGAAPIQLRLIRDRTLICEVSDASSTAPHMRRARVFDEGGRGLLLVAQLTQGWGTRQTTTGKVIWCEQALGDE
ncbi:SpoIIE family protein phosphatase [Actinacidiphila soli]|uniref:SpoIIE family protein phosphatase n=1 Tax=Actinacidiphila soli TaxID=2487275 RepID=UPI0013E32882|nr:SpoIIE family protein phosphatase [Actinacidiphila soli]